MRPDLVIPVDGAGADWPRRVANGFRALAAYLTRNDERVMAIEDQRGFPFPPMSAPPENPQEGQTYYDTTAHKARIYDGTAFVDLH